MRAPLSDTPTATRKPDGTSQLDDIDESTLVYWEERTKESESKIGKAARHIASLIADSKIVRERFRRVFMRVSIRRGAGSLLLYEREQYDGAPLRVYDLTYTTDVTKEDLPRKESLEFTVKDNQTGTQEEVNVYGQILLRLHFAEEGDVSSSVIPSSSDSKKKNKKGEHDYIANPSKNSSSSDGGGGKGKKTGLFNDIGGKSILQAGASLVTGDTESQNRSVCFAFYTTEDREAWYRWFAELVTLRQRSIIEATSTDLLLLDDVDEAGTKGSLFGFTSAFSNKAMMMAMNQYNNAQNNHHSGDGSARVEGIEDDGAGGIHSAAMMEQLSRIPVVGERAFLRSARGRDALRDYSRYFLEGGNSILSDSTSMGNVQVSRSSSSSSSFSTCELTGVLGIGEVTLKWKLLGSMIVKETLDIEMREYRIEASGSSERDILLRPIILAATTDIDENNNTNTKNNANHTTKNQQQQKQIKPQKLMESFVLRAPNFEARASIINWLRRVKGKGEIAQSEEETFPYLSKHGMLRRDNNNSKNKDNNNDGEILGGGGGIDSSTTFGFDASPSPARNILNSDGSPTNFTDFDLSKKKKNKRMKKVLKKRLVAVGSKTNNSSKQKIGGGDASKRKRVTTFKLQDDENNNKKDTETTTILTSGSDNDEEEYEYYYEEEEEEEEEEEPSSLKRMSNSQKNLLDPFGTSGSNISPTLSPHHHPSSRNLTRRTSLTSTTTSQDNEAYENDSNNPRTPDSSRSFSSLNGGPAVSVNAFVHNNYYSTNTSNHNNNTSSILDSYVMDDARLHLYGAANANISGIVFGLSNYNGSSSSISKYHQHQQRNSKTASSTNENIPPQPTKLHSSVTKGHLSKMTSSSSSSSTNHNNRNGTSSSGNGTTSIQMNSEGKLQPFLKMISGPPPKTSTSVSSGTAATSTSATKRFTVRPVSPGVSSSSNRRQNQSSTTNAVNRTSSNSNSKPTLPSAGSFSRHLH